jgi:hypothetical protein
VGDPGDPGKTTRHLGGPAVGPPPGLCGACVHARVIRTARGTVFRLCERSTTDIRYRRYPALPVIACAGFERADHGTTRA